MANHSSAFHDGHSKGIYREDYSFSLLSILRLTSGCHFDSSCFAVAAVCSITFCACSGFCQPRARAPFAHALGDSSMNIHKQVVQTLIRIIEVSDNWGYTAMGMCSKQVHTFHNRVGSRDSLQGHLWNWCLSYTYIQDSSTDKFSLLHYDAQIHTTHCLCFTEYFKNIIWSKRGQQDT